MKAGVNKDLASAGWPQPRDKRQVNK